MTNNNVLMIRLKRSNFNTQEGEFVRNEELEAVQKDVADYIVNKYKIGVESRLASNLLDLFEIEA